MPSSSLANEGALASRQGCAGSPLKLEAARTAGSGLLPSFFLISLLFSVCCGCCYCYFLSLSLFPPPPHLHLYPSPVLPLSPPLTSLLSSSKHPHPGGSLSPLPFSSFHFLPPHKSLCLSCRPRSQGTALWFSKLMKSYGEVLNAAAPPRSCQALQIHLSASTFPAPKGFLQTRPTSIQATPLCNLLGTQPGYFLMTHLLKDMGDLSSLKLCKG